MPSIPGYQPGDPAAPLAGSPPAIICLRHSRSSDPGSTPVVVAFSTAIPSALSILTPAFCVTAFIDVCDESVAGDLFSRIHRSFERETHPHCQPIDLPSTLSIRIANAPAASNALALPGRRCASSPRGMQQAPGALGLTF